ncbi:MAG TPA: hypothetical protein VF889_06425 [Bacteroidota bacterium]
MVNATGYSKRAPAGGFPGKAAAGALVLLLCLAGGCRQDAPVQPGGPPAPALLEWHAGDTFSFLTWATDQYGLEIGSSQCVSVRCVLQTGVTAWGAGNVTVMLDSIALPGAPLRRDTLYFYQSPEGDLWQYGLLASINRRYNGASAPPAWDRLAALSLGVNGIWTAGQADTSSHITGAAFDVSSPWAAVINGASLAFKAERIELYGPLNFGYTVVLSTAPPVFAQIIEPSSSTGPVNGLVRNLTAARIAN